MSIRFSSFAKPNELPCRRTPPVSASRFASTALPTLVSMSDEVERRSSAATCSVFWFPMKWFRSAWIRVGLPDARARFASLRGGRYTCLMVSCAPGSGASLLGPAQSRGRANERLPDEAYCKPNLHEDIESLVTALRRRPACPGLRSSKRASSSKSGLTLPNLTSVGSQYSSRRPFNGSVRSRIASIALLLPPLFSPTKTVRSSYSGISI